MITPTALVCILAPQLQHLAVSLVYSDTVQDMNALKLLCKKHLRVCRDLTLLYTKAEPDQEMPDAWRALTVLRHHWKPEVAAMQAQHLHSSARAGSPSGACRAVPTWRLQLEHCVLSRGCLSLIPPGITHLALRRCITAAVPKQATSTVPAMHGCLLTHSIHT
jgi:hypothetical protein